jgi:hypothetical protein
MNNDVLADLLAKTILDLDEPWRTNLVAYVREQIGEDGGEGEGAEMEREKLTASLQKSGRLRQRISRILYEWRERD